MLFPFLLTALAAHALLEDPAPAAEPLFEEVPDALPGVRTTCGSAEKDFILEVNGGGLALADFDGDGDVDLVVVDGSTIERVRADEPGLPPRLFLNDGSGRFEAAGEAWAMRGGRWGMGCAVGDVNGDRRPDLVVTEWGPDRLFLNRGGAGFEEVADPGFAGSDWSTSAAFGDFDGDGVLDLVVAGYLEFDLAQIAPRGAGGCTWKGHAVMCGPEGLTPVHDRLYFGLSVGAGDAARGAGRFRDVTLAQGFRPRIGDRPAPPGFGLGVTTLDFDVDGHTDVYVANDSTPNHLWRNEGDGRFTEVGFRRGVSHDAGGKEQAGMGIACGDVNGDGRPDLFVTNFSGDSNALYASRGARDYRERSAPTGLGGPSMRFLGWGTSLLDADLDGDLDLIVANGHVYPQADLPGTDTSYAQPDQLYRNDGAGRFRPEPLAAGPDRVSRAAACADLDGDGDLDIVSIELDGEVRVLRNSARGSAASEAASAPHWIAVELAGRGANTFGLGARIEARWKGGTGSAEIRTAGGFQSAVPPVAHFGLGDAERLEVLRVRWPSGAVQTLERVDADRTLRLEEPAP